MALEAKPRARAAEAIPRNLALAQAMLIAGGAERIESFDDVVILQAKAGDIDAAQATTTSVTESSYLSDRALRAFAAAKAQEEGIASTEAWALTSLDPQKRCQVYLGIADAAWAESQGGLEPEREDND